MLTILLSDLEDMAADTAWMAEGSCTQTDPEVFFPPPRSPRAEAAAVRVCSRCPVRERCAEYAIENEIPYGVWGGLSPDERLAAVDAAA